jgi:hypothetical protein
MKKTELKKLTLSELKLYAKEKNIKKYSNLNKDELIKHIVNYKGGDPTADELNKRMKFQECFNSLHVLEKFYLFYSKLNVYFNLYKELYITTKGKNATKNMCIIESTDTSVYICKTIIKNINKEFLNFILENRNNDSIFSENEKDRFKNIINKAVDIIYSCAVFTNDDHVKHRICWHFPSHCALLSGALRVMSKTTRKAFNLIPRSSRPVNSNEIKQILRQIQDQSFDSKFLSLNEINLLGEIGKINPQILNEQSYMIGNKLLYNPIEKYCINRSPSKISQNTRTTNYGSHSSYTLIDIFIDPFRPYGPPYYGQRGYNPYYGPYAVHHSDPYYGTMYYPPQNQPLNSMGESIEAGLRGTASQLGQNVSSLGRNAQNAISGFNYSGTASKVGQYGQNAFSQASQGARNAISGFNSSGTASKIGQFGQNTFSQASQGARNAISGFNSSGMASKVGQFGQNTFSQTSQLGQNAFSQTSQFGQNTFSQTSQLGQNAFSGVGNINYKGLASNASGIAEGVDVGCLLGGLELAGNFIWLLIQGVGYFIGACLGA